MTPTANWGDKKRAVVLLGGHTNSSTRTLAPLERLARLMVADLGRFLVLWVAYRRGGDLEQLLADWPESRTLAGYGHIDHAAYVRAIEPAWAKLRTLWAADADLAMATLLPFVAELMPR